MKGDILYDIVDFILNHASENELEVVRAALKRRVEGDESGGIAGVNPSNLARKIAANMREQIGGSIEQIRETVRGYVTEIIRKDVPELSEDKINELLDGLMPESVQGQGWQGDASAADRGGAAPGAGAAEPLPPPDTAAVPSDPASRAALPEPGSTPPSPGSARTHGGLPPAALATMITQFVAYSTQSMSISEQMRLNDQIPQWHKKYWEAFSPRQRQIISLFLKGEMDEAVFWQRIRTDIGLEAGPRA